MLVKVINSYHKTEELISGKSLESIKSEYMESVKWTANNLAEHEIEPDWKDYYKSKDKASDAAYEGILEQLQSEIKFEIVNKNITISEAIEILSSIPKDLQNLPLYVTSEFGDNFEVSSISLFDDDAPQSLENPLGLNINTTKDMILNPFRLNANNSTNNLETSEQLNQKMFETCLEGVIKKFQKDLTAESTTLAQKILTDPTKVSSNDYLNSYESDLTIECLTDPNSIHKIYVEFKTHNFFNNRISNLGDILYMFAKTFKEMIIYENNPEQPWADITENTLLAIDWSEFYKLYK